MVVQVRLFGALKRYSTSGHVALDLPDRCAVSCVRELIKSKLAFEFPESFQAELVDRSALADETRILGNDELLGSVASLALLPPVCGG